MAPTDVSPVEIEHPGLFQTKPGVAALALSRVAEAAVATKKADEARRVAWSAFREFSQAMVRVRIVENQKRRAEALLAAAEVAFDAATPGEAMERAEQGKAEAAAKVAELRAQLQVAAAEVQPKADAVADARQAAADAETARAAATEIASRAMRELEPVSVLISRAAQRLMFDRDLSLSWMFRSRSGIPIVPLARTSLLPWNGLAVMPSSDGASFRWKLIVRQRARWLGEFTVATRRWHCRPRQTPEAHSTASSSRRTCWIGSPR